MKRVLLILLTFAMTLQMWADDISLTGKAPSAVAVGERFRVVFTVNAPGTEIRCDMANTGLELLYGPSTSSSFSSSIINGKRTQSQTTSFTYTMIAQNEGTFTIPAATVKVDGQTYSSKSLTVKVLPADEQTGSSSGNNNAGSQTGQIGKDDILLNLELSKTKVYEGEAIVATLKLYFRNNPVVSISDAKLPDFEGFTVQEMDLGEVQASLERYKDANYQMYPLKQWLLFPQRSGEIDIPACNVQAIAQVMVRRSMGGFFDMPFEHAQNIEVPVRSGIKKVRITALPGGKPASYSGGVGSFKISSELSSEKVKANDAVTYRVIISGTGNMKYVGEPEPQFPADFEVYDPKIDQSGKTTANGISGRKVIEYTIIPRFAGQFEIPALEFSYFDPKNGQYQTIRTASHVIEVEKNQTAESQGTAIADFSGTTQERLKVLGNDIRYIHTTDVNELQTETKLFYSTWTFRLFYIVPLFFFIVLAVIYRRQLKLNADLDRKRIRGANKLAVRRLKAAATALKSHDEKTFYEALHKAMLGYVADKLGIPLADLSIDHVKTQLAEHGVSEQVVEQYQYLLSTCEFARYAPSSDAQAMDKLYAQAVSTINALEDSLRRR